MYNITDRIWWYWPAEMAKCGFEPPIWPFSVGFQSGASDPNLAHPQPNPANTRPWRGFLPDLELEARARHDSLCDFDQA
jgi:hypothetical protein